VMGGHWETTHHPLAHKLARGDLVTVRSDIAAAAGPVCSARSYTGYFNCHPLRTIDADHVEIVSAAARYNPLYYVVVGTIANNFHGNGFLYAGRATGALLCTFLIGLAVWILLGFTRTAWPLTGLLLAATPTTLYSSTVLAPNGLEMAGGLTLWVSLLALTRPNREQSRPDRTAAYLAAMLAVSVVANAHGLGPVMVALTVAIVVVWRGPALALRRSRPQTRIEWVALAGTVLAVSFSVYWYLTSGANDPGQEATTFSGSPIPAMVNGIVLWPLQAIAAFPLRDQPAPMAIYAIWIALLTVLAVVGLRSTGLRSRVGLIALTVITLSYAVPWLLTAQTYHDIGASWQGRYGFPFTAGLFLLLGWAAEHGGQRVRLARRMPPTVFAFAAVAMGVVEAVGTRATVGHELDDRRLAKVVHWLPPDTFLLIGVCVVAGFLWAAAIRHLPTAVADDEADETRASG